MTSNTAPSELAEMAQPFDNGFRNVKHRPNELRPHPSYIRNKVAVNACQLAALAELRELAFREPLFITRDRIILDGLARWTLARLQKRTELACIEFEISEEEALQYLLKRRRSGLNDFIRISLSLELEPFLKNKARANQQAGGRKKLLSTLTEDASFDVRREIARAAGVSVGNVTKVKQIIAAADIEIIKALREKDLSIHRAWIWSKLSPNEQREKLRRKCSEKGIVRTIRRLVASHIPAVSSPAAESIDVTRLLSAAQAGKLDSVRLASVRIPGRAIFVTEEIFRILQDDHGDACHLNGQ
jgi:hypothetical protein